MAAAASIKFQIFEVQFFFSGISAIRAPDVEIASLEAPSRLMS